MKKNAPRSTSKVKGLSLSRMTLRSLSESRLAQVNGGISKYCDSRHCPSVIVSVCSATCD